LLDFYLGGPESAFTSCSNVKVISDNCKILLQIYWGDNCLEHQVEILVSLYHKTNLPFLQIFLRVRFESWVNNGSYGSCVEEI